MSEKPGVLIVNRSFGALTPVLERAYAVYRLWEGPPVEASATIRALVTAGEIPLDPQLLDSLPALGMIACLTAGYEGIDLADARRRGLKLSYAPGVSQEDVADHALGLIIAARRDIVGGDRRIRAGGWTGPHRVVTQSLGAQRVGIVGLGWIGQALARRCEALGMSVGWWGPRPKPDQPWPRAASLLELAHGSDILAICAALDHSSRGMIDAAVLGALGPKGLLVNVARGGLVDETALIAALEDGRLAGAALDVFEEEPTPVARWRDVPNVVLTPHTGGATDRSVAGMVALMMENLNAYFASAPLKTPIPI